TVPKLETLGMLHNRNSTFVSRSISGIAYGSYARSLLLPILNQLEAMEEICLNRSTLSPRLTYPTIETAPDLLWQAVELVAPLVQQIKSPDRLLQVI
ncbi:MAG TPA: LdpA C-terminal domain-containing domain, partial [Leptolyngbya sp.]|nr:LdpA C-terminal domain-containing domain [Leptolyngbya sp.]